MFNLNINKYKVECNFSINKALNSTRKVKLKDLFKECGEITSNRETFLVVNKSEKVFITPTGVLIEGINFKRIIEYFNSILKILAVDNPYEQDILEVSSVYILEKGNEVIGIDFQEEIIRKIFNIVSEEKRVILSLEFLSLLKENIIVDNKFNISNKGLVVNVSLNIDKGLYIEDTASIIDNYVKDTLEKEINYKLGVEVNE